MHNNLSNPLFWAFVFIPIFAIMHKAGILVGKSLGASIGFQIKFLEGKLVGQNYGRDY